jgi:predicted methyltransferase
MTGSNRARSRRLVLTLFCGVLTLTVCHLRAQDKKEIDMLASLLDWKPGSVVAEIGAGDGVFSLAAAERVGPAGRVYSTELDAKKLAKLKELAAAGAAHHLTVIAAGTDQTNLPSSCCDSIFMRRVYHHFTQPKKEDASLFQSLKPGGLLAVIDFEPGKEFGNLARPKGVPKNRGGHGMPEQLLIRELTAAGFQVHAKPTRWPGKDYCVVFQKPGNR